MKTDMIRTDRGEMAFFRFGKEGAVPVVVLPGLSLFRIVNLADLVAVSFKELAEEHDIYVFDRRNDMPDTYTVEEMAEDTAQAIRAAGLSDVCLYGVSQGGMMAQLIAARHPELVRKMVLASTTCHITGSEEQIFAAWLSFAEAGDVPGLICAFGEKVYSEGFFRQNKEALLATEAWVTEEDLRRFRILTEGTAGYDARPELKEITCPVHVLGDEGDRILHEGAAAELAAALDCTSYIYSGYGHAVYDEAPDFIGRIRDFFV